MERDLSPLPLPFPLGGRNLPLLGTSGDPGINHLPPLRFQALGSYRLNELAVVYELPLVLDLVGRYPCLDLVPQPLQVEEKRDSSTASDPGTEAASPSSLRPQDTGIQASPLTWSFLISFFRSASYFSFWFALAALWS